MTDKSDLKAWLAKASVAIYIAVEESAAADISDGLLKAAQAIAELEAELARAVTIERLALAQVKETTAALDRVMAERDKLRDAASQ